MKFSVLIPTYGRREDLLRTLDAYERQEPADLCFEVVVIDDGSSDGTAEALASWRSRRFPLRFASQQNAGPARARNHALEKARGELVLYTGDDIEPAPDLLAEHLAGHEARDDERVAVLGLTRWPDTWPTRWPDPRAITATMEHVDGPGAQQFSYHYFKDGAEYDFRHLYTSNISLRRSLLDREPAGFATVFPAAAFEDAEFGHRLAFHGLRIIYRASAVAEHHHPYTAGGFYRRQVRCGEMGALLFAHHPELKKWLGLEELERRRLELLSVGAKVDRRFDGHRFDDLRRRAVRIAERFEASAAPGLDDFLRPLFHLGYVQGLATAHFGTEAGQRVTASIFFETLPTAAHRLRKRLVEAGWPRNFSDLEALASAADEADVDVD